MDPNRRPLTSRDYRWVQALARWLAQRGASPNAISIGGMVFATLGAGCYLLIARPADLLKRPELIFRTNLGLIGAVFCIQLRLLCNLLDGLVAVEGGRKGKAGNLFNEAPDRFADVVLLVSAGCAIGEPSLGWMAATFAVGTAYARAFGASLGLGQDFSGPFAKQQRMFFLTLGTFGGLFYSGLFTSLGFHLARQGRWSSLPSPPLYWALWLIALGTLLTFVRRIARIYRQLP